MIKKLAFAAVFSLLLAGLIYLVGSFTVMSFDAGKWDVTARAFAGLMWLLISIFGSVGIVTLTDED